MRVPGKQFLFEGLKIVAHNILKNLLSVIRGVMLTLSSSTGIHVCWKTGYDAQALERSGGKVK